MMAYNVKWTLGACLLVVMLNLSVSGLVLGQDFCTKTTCPPGVVLVLFEYANCTGETTFQAVPAETFCQNGTTSSIGMELTEHYLATTQWYFDGECGASGSQSFKSSRIHYGTCGPFYIGAGRRTETELLIAEMLQFEFAVTAAAGSMLLANVNQTFDAPQEPGNLPPGTYPSYLDTMYRELCYGPNNCTSGDEPAFSWYTLHTNDTCAVAVASEMYANISSGECYEYGPYYARLHCLNEHTNSEDLMIGNGCERVFQSTVLSYDCGGGSPVSLQCTAPPLTTPSLPSPSTPVSQSPQTLATVSFILAIVTPFLAFVAI